MKLFKKIAVIQATIGKLTKDKDNPFHKSKYFDINGLLDSLLPLLEEQNILMIQPIEAGHVITRLINLDDPTEIIESAIELPENENPQKIGSAITYYRRYNLVSLFAIQADDDDANKAAGLGEPRKLNKSIDDLAKEKAAEKKWLNIKDKKGNITPYWENTLKAIYSGKITSVAELREYYKISKDTEEQLNFEFENAKNS